MAKFNAKPAMVIGSIVQEIEINTMMLKSEVSFLYT